MALVAAVGAVIPARPFAVDRRWSSWMDFGSTVAHHLALWLNDLGQWPARSLIVTAIGIVLAVTRRRPALLAFLAAATLTPLATVVLKLLVDRPRPEGALVHAAGSSYPSGHASYAASTAVAVVLLFSAPGRRRVWWLLAALAIVAMAWSRTYLHVHWLTDVVAGALLGAGITFASFAAVQLARPRMRVFEETRRDKG